MKKKAPKLFLHRETLRALTFSTLQRVAGGVPPYTGGACNTGANCTYSCNNRCTSGGGPTCDTYTAACP